MQRIQETVRPRVRTIWQLPCLLFALAASGAAVAEQAKAPPAEDHKYAPARTTYRVSNLGSGPLTTLPKINARGQAIFSIDTGAGWRGYFYNGAGVQDIGTLGGDTLAIDLNNPGQVAGLSFLTNGRERAFVWSPGGGMLNLGVLPGAANSGAQAINNRGVVTGNSEGVPLLLPRAIRWSATDGIESLGVYPSGASSFGAHINDAGLIAGTADTPDNKRQSFVWTRTGGLVNIDTLDSDYSEAVGVGARGEVAGNRVPAGGQYRAFFWTRSSGMLDLGMAGGTESFSMAMSPGGHIAALVNLRNGTQRAASWTRAGGLRLLGTLGGATSRAIALNNKGQIVGYAADRAQALRAFVWSAGTGMVNLNSRLRAAPPGLVLEDALAINDAGAIVAMSNAGLVLLQPGHGAPGGHVVGPVQAPELVQAGTPLRASVAWIDEARAGTRGVSWSWGDGSGGSSTWREGQGRGGASASHSYAEPGIYTVRATVQERSGRSTAVSRRVVVTPAGGALVGQGTLLSPRGALAKSPLHVGQAQFSLIAPTRDTAGASGRLQFDLPGLNLRSDSLRLVGRQGAEHVYEGSGSVGGTGGYRFRLAATAGAAGGGQGGVGLKVWRTGPAGKGEVVVYDNGRAGGKAGALAAGVIVSE